MTAISVIVPVFNGARYLTDAIDSILAQTYTDLEVLIVDDGSTDETSAVAQRYPRPVYYHYQPNAGLSAARNTGLVKTTGPLVAFLDADDMWHPDKIAIQVRQLERNPDVDAVFAHMESFISPDLTAEARSRLARPPAPQPAWSAGTMLIRRTALEAVGGFSPDVQTGEFMEWLFRAREAGLNMVMLPQILMRRRLHRTNMGLRNETSRAEYAQILKAALDRRRGEAAV